MFLNRQCYNISIQLDMFAGVARRPVCAYILECSCFCRLWHCVKIEDVSSVVNPG